jgi:hypothetical protein
MSLEDSITEFSLKPNLVHELFCMFCEIGFFFFTILKDYKKHFENNKKQESMTEITCDFQSPLQKKFSGLSYRMQDIRDTLKHS